MAFVKKTWKNRIAEYINRRLLTKEDGSTELVTVARDEGQVSQEGDAFNAANMNDLEDRIAAGFTEINQSLANGKIKFGIDSSGNYGYIKDGADTVIPFKSYDQGYAQGVTDADNRANANSTNYKTGYNNGYNAGKSDGALTGVSGCCIAGWRSIDAYSNNQWVSGWTGVNPNYFTVNGYGIVPKRNFTATVYWQGYNKRDIDFYSNGVMGHRDNGTSMNGVKMNFYAGTQCGFKTNDSGGGSLGAGFIVLN